MTSCGSELGRWGILCWPSHASFVLGESEPLHAEFVKGMEALGVLVHDRSRDHGCEGCVRISIGKMEHTAQLLGALGKTLAQIGAKEVIRNERGLTGNLSLCTSRGS